MFAPTCKHEKDCYILATHTQHKSSCILCVSYCEYGFSGSSKESLCGEGIEVSPVTLSQQNFLIVCLSPEYPHLSTLTVYLIYLYVSRCVENKLQTAFCLI